MKAAVIEHLHQPAVIRDIPQPAPAAHEILVRVIAAGVNPIDWKTRERGERAMPFVLGQDFAGVVSQTGSRVQKYLARKRVAV